MNTEQLKERLTGKVESINADRGYIALRSNTIDIIKQNLKNQPLSFQLFDTVKAPSGGSTVFTVPGISGDEIERSISGIILDYTMPRAYWETPEPVEGTPPTCYSKNSLVSFDGKACCSCPFNDFGSRNGESNAKACKESVALFMLRPGNIMPIIVRIPVSSKVIFQRYLTRLIGRMLPVSGVVTKITLERTTNKLGQPYSQYSFEAVEVLSPDEAAKAKAFGEGFMRIMDSHDSSGKAAG